MEFVVLLLVLALALFIVRSSRRPSKTTDLSIRANRIIPQRPHAEVTMSQEPRAQSNNPKNLEIKVTVPSSPAKSYAIPEAPPDLQNDPETHWVPADQTVRVQTFKIAGGMFYMGSGLRSLTDNRVPEPSLIDPSLTLDRGRTNYDGTGVGYWPSYSKLTPQSRAGLLEWLAGGRRHKNAYIGYVFIFFYGLERRFFADLASSPIAKTERMQIVEEVERLRSLYRSNNSFDRYTSAFLEIAFQAVGMSVHEGAPPRETESYAMDPRLKVGLAQMIASDLAIPSEWALAWLRSQPDLYLRTPAHRCREYFEHLFKIRYDQTFGDGLKLKPNRKSLPTSYRPATPSLSKVTWNAAALPDVSGLSAPTSRLRAVAEQACNELDAYSRWLGKNPESQESLASFSLLPVELVPVHTSSDAGKITKFLEARLGQNVTALVDVEEMLLYWPCKNPSKISKSESVLLAQALEKLGFSFEPDPRFSSSRPRVGESLAVFRLPQDHPSAPSDEYAAATLLLHLAAMVSGADDEVSTSEREVLLEHLTRALHLDEGEKRRLQANMEWTLAAQPGMAGLKKRIRKLTTAQRSEIADFLVAVAAADGHISPAEIRVLEKSFQLFGFDRDDVYSKVHMVATSGETLAESPQKPGAPMEQTPVEQKDSYLDFAAIEKKLAETAAVSSLLGNIFAEEEELAEEPEHALPQPAIGEIPLRIGPLDEAHSAFLRALCEVEPMWERIEIERLAESFTLMTDGALETINDYAFEKAGEPLCEGEDPVEINLSIARELLQ